MELIKRYDNRKLYSTMLSKYVTLDYILDLVRSNQKFQVVSNKNTEDITNSTIKQSLLLLDINTDDLTTLIRRS